MVVYGSVEPVTRVRFPVTALLYFGGETMTTPIKPNEDLTTGDMLKFIFLNADAKKVNFCTHYFHETVYMAKNKYKPEFEKFFFCINGNGVHHSSELEMYLSGFATWKIIDIPSNGCELKFFWEESKGYIAKLYQQSSPNVKLRIEEITNSLIGNYKQVLTKFNDSWHSHSLK